MQGEAESPSFRCCARLQVSQICLGRGRNKHSDRLHAKQGGHAVLQLSDRPFLLPVTVDGDG